MKRQYPLILLALLFSFFGCGQKSFSPAENQLETRNGFFSNQTDTLAKYLDKMPNGTQIACAIIQDSVPYFYGILREADQLQTVENHEAVYEIGSISKVMTASLLANQVQKGKIQLSGLISPHLTYQLKDEVEISFQQLANHTSGLPRVPTDMVQDIIFNRSNPYKNYDTTRLRKYLTEKLEMASSPGTVFGYSNLGAGLLGFTLEQISGQTYESMLQDAIFKPYQMLQSTTNRDIIKEQLIEGRDMNGKVTANWDLTALAGAGAVLSSTQDLVQFALAQFDANNHVLALTREQTYQHEDLGGVGLGWMIMNKNDSQLYWHNGGTGGYKAFMMIDPATQNGVVVLSNCSAFSDQAPKIDSLGQALLDSLNK